MCSPSSTSWTSTAGRKRDFFNVPIELNARLRCSPLKLYFLFAYSNGALPDQTCNYTLLYESILTDSKIS